MGVYRCMFCGVTYHTNRRIMTCTVCGKTTASGWLQKEESSVLVPAQHLLPTSPAHECKNETKDGTGRRHAERRPRQVRRQASYQPPSNERHSLISDHMR